MKTNYYLDVCRRLKQADIVLKNASILNVFTKEIIVGDLAISDNKIIGIGDYRGEREIDIKQKFVVPGFIDSHVHIESSMISPCEFSKTILPFGTTTLIADPHEIANVCGLDGVKYMIEKANNAPGNIYYMLPSCVPATDMESSGAVLDAKKLEELINHPKVLGLGEMMNYPGVILGDTRVLEKIKIANGKIVDGHAPGLTGYDLSAYVFAGINTDHECSTIEETLERIRLGMVVQIRKGSAANNLSAIVKGLVSHKMPFTRCVFCTDDKHLEDILEEGHIDSNIRESIMLGVPAIEAICMATLYPAQTYNLKTKGALAPGYDADLVILDSLDDVAISDVMVGGVWQHGKYATNSEIDRTSGNVRYDRESTILSTMNCVPIDLEDISIKLSYPRVHVIEIIDNEILTKKVVENVNVYKGNFVPDATYSKIAVIERHNNTGNMGLGIIKNFGIQGGAIAQTIAHDSHNIICVGDSDFDMCLAANTLIEKQGGIVVVQNGKVVESLSLPIAGLMSSLNASQVIEKLKKLLEAAKKLDINPNIDPFLTLAFMALPVIPELKMTDLGLFDVTQFKHISIEA
ncbi:MAG: adenine deaminase [Cellulosilyticaceae bacterium]